MPREQVEWYVKQSSLDDDKIHARQRCTYCSIININKANYPYSTSFEREQTWTLSQTMSNHNKRYQSSIENIHLTRPSILTVVTPFPLNTKRHYYENDRIKIDRSISFLPPLPPSRQHALSAHRLNRSNMDSKVHQKQTLTTSNSSSNINSVIKKSRPITNLMRIMHINGEFVVRI